MSMTRPTAATRRAVLERQGGRCAGTLRDGERCPRDLATVARAVKLYGLKLPRGRTAVEYDHIEPRCDGGGNEPDNIQALCGWCHHDKTEIERPAWEAPTPSAFNGRLAARPAPEHRPASKTLRLRGKAPNLQRAG